MTTPEKKSINIVGCINANSYKQYSDCQPLFVGVGHTLGESRVYAK